MVSEKKRLWRPSFCSLNSVLMQTQHSLGMKPFSLHVGYKKVLSVYAGHTWGTWLGERREACLDVASMYRYWFGFLLTDSAFFPLLLEENTSLTLAPSEGGLFKTLVLVEVWTFTFSRLHRNTCRPRHNGLRFFQGNFCFKNGDLWSSVEKKIKRWHLFTWHMVPGLEGICGGVDRTVYGALGT